MNVSVKGEYAIQAIFDLAVHAGTNPIRIAEIAARQTIPQKFLELILASLKQGGFVESRRGSEGGYLLARPADAITVGEVLRFVDGKSSRSGKAKRANPFSGMWKQVDEAVSSIVDHTTFAEVARNWRESQTEYVPNWDI